MKRDKTEKKERGKMIYIATAMMIEAKEIIKYYNLKKDSAINKIEVFKNEDITLVVAGVGGLKSAISLTYILSKCVIGQDDIFINMGICGAKNRELKIGDVVMCNKVISKSPKISYYPDMLFNHPFKEGSLESFSAPKYGDTGVVADVVDMEGAGLSQSLLYFFKPHQVSFLKIVSDYLENSVTPQRVTEVMAKALPKIDSWIKSRATFKTPQEIGYSKEEKKKIDEFIEVLRLTKTMEARFLGYMRYYKLMGKDICEILEKHLYGIENRAVEKKDVKKILEEIEILGDS